nr:DinB family protein [Alicyclobacillus sp. ALC3]
MMNYARWTTLEAVKGLTAEQLDYRMDENANSIGALLSHFAAVETWYYVQSIEKRDMTPQEEEELKPAIELGEAGKAIEGHELAYYLHMLNRVRSRTLTSFANLTDEWLADEESLGEHRSWNNYWKWFHVFEDEVNHRGQIRIIRRRLPL